MIWSVLKFILLLPDLLEKARVISQQALERSYHIFYQMMSGSVNGLKGTYIHVTQNKLNYLIGKATHKDSHNNYIFIMVIFV